MNPKMANYVATFFGLGLVRKFPGSIASLATVLIWYILILFFNFSILVILFTNLFIFFSAYKSIVEYQKTSNKSDPQEIVIDEVSGMSISLIGGSLYFTSIHFLLAFLIFRVLDFFKPSIIYRFEVDKKDSSILMDDVVAGFFTLIIMLSLSSSGIV